MTTKLPVLANIAKLAAVLAVMKDDAAPAPVEASQESAAGPAAMLQDVYARLGALVEQAGKAGGALPEDSAAEVKTLAGKLLSLLPGGGELPAEAPAGEAAKAWVTKALAPEIELSTTVNYVSGQWWRISDLLRDGKGDEAKTMLGKVLGMLNALDMSAAGAAAPEAEKAMKRETVEFTPDTFAAWSVQQLAKAATESAEEATARLANLQACAELVTKGWEQTGAEPKIPISIEMSTVYRPFPETKDAVVDTDEQSVTEQPAAGGNESTSQDSNFAANASEVLGKAVTALAATFAPKLVPDGATGLAKADKTPAPAFSWPGDVNDYERDEDGARIRKTRMDGALPRNLTRKAAPKTDDDSWGADPSTVRG